MARSKQTVEDVRNQLRNQQGNATGDDTPNPKFQEALNANLGVAQKSEAAEEQKEADRAAQTTAAPWEGYDDLSVAEINERTATLSDQEKANVRTYEQANKRRKGILDTLA